MAYQSEIELRIKVLDKELKEVEERIKRVQNPFQASGAQRRGLAQAAALRAQKAETQLIKKAIDDVERLRETKAQKTQQTNLKRVRFLRDQRIKAARDVANAERKFLADQQRAEKKAIAERQKLERAAATRRSKRRQGIATGFGFPLLFGGGPLQALAGGIGGAAAGLGGSIAASALVSQLEGFAQGTAKAGQALNSTGGALDLMREKSLFSSKAVEEQAAVLEEQGKVAELSALLTGELVDKIGNNGVQALQKLGTETDETARLWGELTLQLQTLIAGPLAGFLSLVNNFVGGITNRGRLASLREDLKGTQAGRALEARIERIAPATETLIQGDKIPRPGVLTNKQVEELLEDPLFARPVKVKLPITGEDKRRFAVKGRKDTAGANAARDEERLQQRLRALELERQKIIEISRFKDKIAAAEIAGDSQLVIRLQGEQRIAQIQNQLLKDLVKVTDQREIDAININAATEKLAQQREIERQLAEDQRRRQELFETTISKLETQLKVTEATSQAERDRLNIEQKLQKLRKDGDLSEGQISQIGSLMEQLAEARKPLAALFVRRLKT